MKASITAVALWAATSAGASAAVDEHSLPTLMHEASICTDQRVAEFAKRSCDPPTVIADMAVRACHAKWEALGLQAVQPPAAGASATVVRNHARSLQTYVDGMTYEYAKIAELKVIDIRLQANTCRPAEDGGEANQP